jgi:hypothetical protein
MRKKITVISFFICTLISVLAVSSKKVEAHVLLTDDTGKIGAILHVSPDDDPIAGEPSSLFYELQGDTFLQHLHAVSVEIVNERGESAGTNVSLSGSSASSSYTFPEQGIYTITLTATTLDSTPAHTHSFTHMQRVTRGILGSPLDTPSHQWASMLLTASITGLGILVILFINHKTDITKYSKW